jgi:hypothetical protein
MQVPENKNSNIQSYTKIIGFATEKPNDINNTTEEI